MRFLASLLPAIAAPLIAGCLATVNLLDENNSTLTRDQRAMAVEISEKVKTSCSTHSYEPGSKRKLSGDVKISGSIDVKRMHTSDSGWYKLHILTRGVWDNVYYHPENFKLVCGDNLWGEHRESRNTLFEQIEVKTDASIKSTKPMLPAPQPKHQLLIEERLRTLRDFREKNLISEKQYNEQVNKALSDR